MLGNPCILVRPLIAGTEKVGAQTNHADNTGMKSMSFDGRRPEMQASQRFATSWPCAGASTQSVANRHWMGIRGIP